MVDVDLDLHKALERREKAPRRPSTALNLPGGPMDPIQALRGVKAGLDHKGTCGSYVRRIDS